MLLAGVQDMLANCRMSAMNNHYLPLKIKGPEPQVVEIHPAQLTIMQQH